MHVLPNKKIPFSSLPLDLMISAKVSFMKHQQELQIEEAKSSPIKAKLDKKKEEANKNAGIIVIDEFKFAHGVYLLEKNHVKDDVLQSAYSKLYNFLNFEHNPGKLILHETYRFWFHNDCNSKMDVCCSTDRAICRVQRNASLH